MGVFQGELQLEDEGPGGEVVPFWQKPSVLTTTANAATMNAERQYRELVAKHEALKARHAKLLARREGLVARVRRSRQAWAGPVPAVGEKPFTPAPEPIVPLLDEVLAALEGEG